MNSRKPTKFQPIFTKYTFLYLTYIKYTNDEIAILVNQSTQTFYHDLDFEILQNKML